MKEFQEERVIQILKDIVNLESENPMGNEEKCSQYIFDFFTSLGVSVELQTVHPNRHNVIATIGSGNPILLYNGHIDVVPAGNLDLWTSHPYQCEERDNKLYGRGTCDMKGSVASMLHAAEYIKNNNLLTKGTLKMSFTIDEEKSNTGIKHFLDSGVVADACIVGEPSELDVNIGHRGVMAFKVIVKGRACHAAKPNLGINAIYKAMKFVEEIQKLNKALSQNRVSYLGHSLISVTMFNSAIKVNMVPNEAEICVDRRLLPSETKEKCEKEIVEIIQKLKKEDIEFDAEWETTTYCPAGMIDENHKIVQCLLQSGEQFLESKPEIKSFGATCEASFFMEKGIQTVIYGPGSLDQAHNVDEYIEKSHLLSCAKIYTDAILKFLNQ